MNRFEAERRFAQRMKDNYPPGTRIMLLSMGNMRTLAFQVPEDLFQRIKDYLQRNNMTQKEFMLGLIEDELDREQTERENAAVDDCEAVSEETENYSEEETENGFSDDSGGECEDSEDEDESENESTGFSMGM